eukprot:CAMPEP_0113623592 /NCGR_PEP_ID=MMETSP0017_2-20120614/12141_1 /TAXON_ID=2856 /ORGANISM="Cylindrotheca closterium" /LENGTH=601 /DNA_ID=CAMNT_0000533555 /DNA_START=87 /DNA_END=1892 /DNA_ORIENTATION=+ /assembly_acc=CAM_ASM_000147
MGQGHSSSTKRDEDVSMYPQDVQRTHHKVLALRDKLAVLKAEGKANKKKRKKQIKELEKEKMELHVTLMKLGKHAQRHFSFWEYVRIIRSTFNSTSAVKQIQGSSITLGKDKEVPATRAIVKQSDAVQYTIFAFYEGYLLKKLHVAMMLKTQKKLHAKGWNDMVMFLYYEIPKIQTSFEKAEAKIVHTQHEEEGHKSHVDEAYQSHIQNQKNLMAALQDACEGKVRVAPEGTQFSFKKKSLEREASASSSRSGLKDGSSRSFKDGSVASSQRSVDSSDSGSGSFRKKTVRSSMYGPAYEAGSSKKEVYQAPWMKNSRNKLKKSTEKARGEDEPESSPAPAPAPFNRAAKFKPSFKKSQVPKEEEEEEEAAKAPAPGPFNRKAKFATPFKKKNEPEPAKEEPAPEPEPEPEPVKEEPEPEPVKEEPEPVKEEPEPVKEEPEPVKEEPEPVKEEPEPVKEEPEPVPEPVKDVEDVDLNDAEPAKPSSDKSPDETAATGKSTEGEEEVATKKKKKKKNLPKGMPETLEIDTGSGDEYSVDGAGEPVKKKKKKKKKKAVSTESEDEDFLEGEGVVKKKKKKKKKPGVSSNSSVVSELSNGSSLHN